MSIPLFNMHLRFCMSTKFAAILPFQTVARSVPANCNKDGVHRQYRTNVRMTSMMRALYDGNWEHLVFALMNWHRPILSRDFIKQKLLQIDHLDISLTTMDAEEAAMIVCKLEKALDCTNMMDAKVVGDDANSDNKLLPEQEELVSRIRALVNGMYSMKM